MGFRIVVGRGKDRYQEPVVQTGKESHAQRRAVKMHIGLLKVR